MGDLVILLSDMGDLYCVMLHISDLVLSAFSSSCSETM